MQEGFGRGAKEHAVNDPLVLKSHGRDHLRQREDDVKVLDRQELAGAFEIRSIPTLMVLRDRVLLFSQAGALPETALEDLVRRVRAVDMDAVRAQIADEQKKEQKQEQKKETPPAP